MSVPGPIQTGQRAEYWVCPQMLCSRIGRVILVLITSMFARSIRRLLDRGRLSKPLPLVKDGDLAAINSAA